MKVSLKERALVALGDAEPAVQRAFIKQLNFLARNLQHPSLHAKKYDEARDIWEARVNDDWRFYFTIERHLRHSRRDSASQVAICHFRSTITPARNDGGIRTLKSAVIWPRSQAVSKNRGPSQIRVREPMSDTSAPAPTRSRVMVPVASARLRRLWTPRVSRGARKHPTAVNRSAAV
jgi:hypothetical protein